MIPTVVKTILLASFIALYTPLTIAQSCDSLLVMISGAGDDQTTRGIFGEPLLKYQADFLRPIYQRSSIEVIYYKYRLGRIDKVFENARTRINAHRTRCPQAAIGIVGYSWGGDGAYKLAETSGTTIQVLVTLDPVSLFDNPNPTRYRDKVFLFNQYLPLAACFASVFFPPAAPLVCGTAFGLNVINIGVKITTELLDDGNVPNPDNVKTWIHVWASGKWSTSDFVASFGAWLYQKHPDVRIKVNTSHNDVCYMYKAAERPLLSELVVNGNVPARIEKEWETHECYRYAQNH